ncbi:tetratricopeptide repeat protein [Luteolibacter arcticus]|uniref:Tetratricopeptide repeat protein n=1 Tax=Luteolibacter arcticus TaxID=1581411 RepID=A0ABT3GKW7_9BACT|nr:tetratricopeptide repeat protein [Luteolibacter arcticus]MCW1924154.1 tetratricopeptide repeat protein [Luteolibacter arcticus]
MTNPPTTDSLPAQRIPDRFIYIALFAVMCAVVALAWPGLRSPSFLDDLDHAAHVTHFSGWKDTLGTDCFGLFRPFKNIVYYSFHRFGTPPPLLWHSIPLGLYLGAVAAVFALSRRLTSSSLAGLAAAALWALSATQTTTVIWMACFNISLSVILICLAVLQYDRSWDSARPWAGRLPACLVLTFLALVSYETALCIAPVCVATDVLRKRRLFSKPALLRYAALAAVTLGFLVLRHQLGGVSKANYNNFSFDPEMPLWKLSVSAPWLMWRHFSMWFFPFGRVEFMSTYIWGKSASMLDLAGAWGFFLMLVAAWGFTLRRLPLFAFGIAWYFLASFPSSNFIPLRSGPIEDYYVVVPGVGLAIAVVALLRAARGWIATPQGSSLGYKKLTATCLVGSILVLKLAGIPLFWHQATLWNDPLRLYLAAAYDRPAQFQQKNLAARELIYRGDYVTAKQLVDESLADGPWYTINYLLLGEIAIRAGDYKAAADYFDRSQSMADTSPRFREFIHLRRAEIHVASGNLVEARDLLLPLLRRTGGEEHYPATVMLADIYFRQGDREKARKTLEKSATFHPQKRGEIEQLMLQLASQTSVPTGN